MRILHSTEDSVVGCDKRVTLHLNGTCNVQRVFAFETFFRQGLRSEQNPLGLIGVANSVLLPGLNRFSSFIKGIGFALIVQGIRPGKFQSPFKNVSLNKELCFGLKLNSWLALIIKRTVEATVVQIDSHNVTIQHAREAELRQNDYVWYNARHGSDSRDCPVAS